MASKNISHTFRTLAVVTLMILIGGCTIMDTVDENGILWEYYTTSPITLGVDMMPSQNLLFFADEANTLYAIDAGSGLLRWKITPVITLTSLLPLENQLFIAGYSNTGENVLYTIDTLNGAIVAQKSLPLRPLPNRFLSTADGIVLYSSSQAVILSNNGSLSTPFPLANGIIAMQRLGSDYYALIRESDNSTTIQKYNQNFVQGSSSHHSHTPTGSLFPWNTKLYIGTTTSLLSSDTSPTLSLFKPFPVKSSLAGTGLLLFVPSADSLHGGIRAYDATGNEQWFTATYAPISYAPLVYSGSYQVVFSLDDNGNLGVYDATTGRLLFQRYLGTIQKNGLKLPLDLYQNYIFIPFSSPAKLVCFSLRYASTSK